MRRLVVLSLGLIVVGSALAGAQGRTPAVDLRTVGETSGFVKTGRYDEVERLCAAFGKAWPAKVRCVEFGKTPEARPMLVLVASGDGTLTPQAAKTKARPVVLMQGGIHAGEIDGKDAGFQVLRELLDGGAAPGVLDKVTFVFVPVLNVDGHERVSRANRPNQNGPEEMGWRVTSQNLNLNRDYVKADAPEMQALLRLLGDWDPILYADLHVTDGAQFEHDISFNVSPTLAGDAGLRAAANGVLRGLLDRLKAAGSLPLDFYPSFRTSDDPASGFEVSVGPPRFSQEYWGLRNRIGVLVETHSWKPYAHRVKTTRASILAMLELAAAQGSEWRAAAGAADLRDAQLRGPVPLAYRVTDHVKPIEFRGYAYTRTPSAISGGLVTRYDPTRPEIWRVPLYDEVTPALSVEAPRGGYIVPAGYVALVEAKLALHGIESRRVAAAQPKLDVQTFRATKVTRAAATFEGRTTVALEGAWKPETRDLPAGSLFVPIAQSRARLAMALLEPGAPDALVTWGFFNGVFERKEYMEGYVAEKAAEEMLAADPELRKAFAQRLAAEPDFARDPALRLDFFFRRHPAFDERFNLYPVYRVAAAPR
jgi:hypothetical protein